MLITKIYFSAQCRPIKCKNLKVINHCGDGLINSDAVANKPCNRSVWLGSKDSVGYGMNNSGDSEGSDKNHGEEM